MACDLAAANCADELFKQKPFDAVIHLAGLADPRACRTNPEQAQRDNTEATGNLVEVIRQSDQRPRMLYVSTSFVYGRPLPEDLPIRINCPIRTEEPYGASKWAAEQLSEQFATEYGLDIIRVRPFNHTGPRQPAGYAIPDWTQQIAAVEAGTQPAVLRVGNLETRRDYTDVRDVVRAYRLLIEKAATNTVHNLGCGVSRSGREILGVLHSLSRVHWTIEEEANRIRAGEAWEIVADAGPIRELTGWQPEIDIATTLRDTLDFWRERRYTSRGPR